MKKRIITSVIITLLTSIILPLAIIFSIGGINALGILLLVAFIINPLVSIIIGILSGTGKTVLWYLPVINAAVFLIATSIITGFDLYYIGISVAYIGIGLAAAYITAAIKNKKKNLTDSAN